MNSSEDTGKVIALVRMLWTHSNLGDDMGQVVRLWDEMLKPFSYVEVERALLRLSKGREHAPPLGVLVQEVERDRSGEALAFDDVAAALGRYAWCLPYRPQGMNPPEDKVVALDALFEAGAPELLARFVSAWGVYGCRTLPDGSRYPLDMNQRGVVRDAARMYRDDVVPDWRADPRPGLALDRAVRQLGSPPEERRIRRARPLRAIEPPADVAPGPELSPEEIAEQTRELRRLLAANRPPFKRVL